MTPEPIACKLNGSQLEERKRLIANFTALAVERTNLVDGVQLRFNDAPGLIVKIARLIELEAECCRFLAFRLDIAAAGAGVTLTITGPAEAVPIIRELILKR